MTNKKIKIKLSTDYHDAKLFLRQTPGENGICNNVEFYVDQDITDYDFWFIYGRLPKCQLPQKNNIYFIPGEPPSVRNYNHEFLKPFAGVISFRSDLPHQNIIGNFPPVFWRVGQNEINGQIKSFAKNYDEIINFNHYKKTKLISVVC